MENLDHAVTRCLDDIRAGVQGATNRLFSLCYEEIHALAASRMRHQQPGHSWAATDLAHEVYGRVVGSLKSIADRRHFFGAVVNAMRHALIDRARKKRRSPESLAQVLTAFHQDQGFEFEALNLALERLEAVDGQSATIVKFRFLAGLPIEEIAELLEVSKSTVERRWRHAQAWLKRAIEDLDP